MSLAAGRLRHRVTLQRQSATQDATTGEMIVSWVTVAELWAHVEPLSVREFIASAAMQSEVSAKVTIRYRTDINATMRFVFRGKLYNIAGVLPDNVSGLEYITLPCSEGVGDGS